MFSRRGDISCLARTEHVLSRDLLHDPAYECTSVRVVILFGRALDIVVMKYVVVIKNVQSASDQSSPRHMSEESVTGPPYIRTSAMELDYCRMVHMEAVCRCRYIHNSDNLCYLFRDKLKK